MKFLLVIWFIEIKRFKFKISWREKKEWWGEIVLGVLIFKVNFFCEIILNLKIVY